MQRNIMSARRLCGLFSGITACAVLLLVLAMGGESGAQSTADYAAILAAPDRSDADRQADTRRDPKPFLAFAGLRPGMKVLDMGAGGGYAPSPRLAQFTRRILPISRTSLKQDLKPE
jgi:hypothetical protein